MMDETDYVEKAMNETHFSRRAVESSEYLDKLKKVTQHIDSFQKSKRNSDVGRKQSISTHFQNTNSTKESRNMHGRKLSHINQDGKRHSKM